MMSMNNELMKAAATGSIKNVERCIGETDCDPLVRNEDGTSALMLAASHGYEECVRLLLARSDPLAKDGGGRTALMWAASGGHQECVELLLARSDPLAKDGGGRTALMWAVIGGSEDCVKLLLPHSDILDKDGYGRSAIECAKGGKNGTMATMIKAYALARSEAALITKELAAVPSLRASIKRI